MSEAPEVEKSEEIIVESLITELSDLGGSRKVTQAKLPFDSGIPCQRSIHLLLVQLPALGAQQGSCFDLWPAMPGQNNGFGKVGIVC